MSSAEVALHEAGHIAAAIMLRRPVEYAWRETGFTEPGETLGFARIPIRDRVEPSQLVIALAGRMGVGEKGWPPQWSEARDERLEGLDLIIAALGIGEDGYHRAVEVTRNLLADDHFLKLRNAIARALAEVPRLEREDIEALCRATNIPVPTGAP